LRCTNPALLDVLSPHRALWRRCFAEQTSGRRAGATTQPISLLFAEPTRQFYRQWSTIPVSVTVRLIQCCRRSRLLLHWHAPAVKKVLHVRVRRNDLIKCENMAPKNCTSLNHHSDATVRDKIKRISPKCFRRLGCSSDAAVTYSFKIKKVKVAHTRLPSVWFRADPGSWQSAYR